MKTARMPIRLLLAGLALSVAACTNRLDVEGVGAGGEAPATPDEPSDPTGPGNGTIGTPGTPGTTGEPGDPGDPADPDPPSEPTMREALRNDLVWKRYRAVERDLVRGLSLGKETLCNELGRYSCVDDVHLALLGGNEPFEKSQYEPAKSPTATTPVALDRVVLAACSRRVSLDTTSEPQVFTALDLTAPLAPDDPGVDETLTTLYRRLLARDPSPEELEVARQLAVDDDGQPVGAADFARLACYAVGTSVEFLFY